MDILHRVINDILGIAGVSEELYARLGHGRWIDFFKTLTTAHAIVHSEEGTKP